MMTKSTQPALFEDVPQPTLLKADVDFAARARERLSRWIHRLQAAEAPSPTAQDLRAWEAIVPNMVRWLPEDEARRAIEEFGLALQHFRCRSGVQAETT